MRRGSFTSIEDLVAKVRGFIAYDNRTMATPVKWTYQGKTLVAYSAELSLPRCTRRTP